jgi:hypothetical protein
MGSAVTNDSSKMLDRFRATLLQLERNEVASPHNPALLDLKSILLERIAELEGERVAEGVPVSQSQGLLDASKAGEAQR